MEVIYAHETFPDKVRKSLFLAGPTIRRDPTNRQALMTSWRVKALQELEMLGFEGHVFVPEPKNGIWDENLYEDQLEWEEEGLHRADCILFWVPRDMQGVKFEDSIMPGLTTNDEWGFWKNSGKVIWGSPKGADHTRYQQYYASKLGVSSYDNLSAALLLAELSLGEGSLREDGEACIPLHIWTKPEFQSWLTTQKSAGNRLDGARVVWSFFPRPGLLFSYALHIDIFINAENRSKTNELVIFRHDLSSVLLYQVGGTMLDTKVVLVKEFRSAVRNSEAYVHELPGGSSETSQNPLSVAVLEVLEETGFTLDPNRLKAHTSRQLMSTFSAHMGTLYSAVLSDTEMAALEAAAIADTTYGAQEESEVTRIRVKTIRQILESDVVDWTTLGMIFSAIQG